MRTGPAAAPGSWCACRREDHETGRTRGRVCRDVPVGRVLRGQHTGLAHGAEPDVDTAGTGADDHAATGSPVNDTSSAAVVAGSIRQRVPVPSQGIVRLSSGHVAGFGGRMVVTMKRGDTTR